MLCDGQLKFVMASLDHARRYSFLAAAEPISAGKDRVLWRVDVSDAGGSAVLGRATMVSARAK